MGKRDRISIVYITDQLAMGGDTRAEYLTLRLLDPGQHVLTVYCSPGGASADAFASIPAVQFRRVCLGTDRPRTLLWRIRATWEFLSGTVRVIARSVMDKPDVVLVGDRPRSLVVGYLAALLSRANFVYHPQYYFNPYGLGGRIQKWAAPRARLVICHSEHSAASYRAIGVSPNGLVTMPNPVDVDHFMPGDRSAAKRSLGVPVDAFVVGATSNMLPSKGHEHLIRGFADALRDHSELFLLLAGNGPLRDELQKMCEELGIRERVSFCGYVADLRDVYQAMDVFVMASLEEPFGLVTVEAMSCGLPVIGTASGGTLEIVVPDVTGILVPPADAESLAKAIVHLRERGDQARELGSAGRRRAMERFAAPQRTRSLARALEGLHRHGRDPGSAEDGSSDSAPTDER